MKSIFNRAGASALALVLAAPMSGSIAYAAAPEKPGSAYVQCDGQPNNVTSGETAARLIGAVTLLGLFAPAPEAPDASKRKFGEAGVAACNSLLTGDSPEGNSSRRLGLIFGRALHQIEAKNYQAALDDVAMARREAKAAGLTANPYFARSRGRAFDLIESAALVRMGRAEEARAASLRGADVLEYSVFPLFSTPTYAPLLPAPSAEEDRLLEWQGRLIPNALLHRADRLDLAGRFTDSARLRDAYVEFDVENSPELNSSIGMAGAALAHALAGNFEAAAERAKAARANAEKRKSEGKPETDLSQYVELLDLYDILETARGGDSKTARRLFSARSQWVGVSLGSVMEVNRRLRQGAAADELIGGLSKTPEQLWKEQAETARAALLAKDSDNKTLFALAPGLRPANGYEALSKNVWRADKSKIILKTKTPSKYKMETLFLPFVDPLAAMDGYVLHAALIAKSRGHEGFVFSPLLTDNLVAAWFRTGNRGEKGFPADLFIPAEDAIAKLSPIIPAPATLEQKRAAKQ
ncbi:MAG TPA: hypothetical protein VIA98_10455 [Allosphingosinicella sp.]